MNWPSKPRRATWNRVVFSTSSTSQTAKTPSRRSRQQPSNNFDPNVVVCAGGITVKMEESGAGESQQNGV
eukprot:5202023-Pyramimonas_sp.AAC.1